MIYALFENLNKQSQLDNCSYRQFEVREFDNPHAVELMILKNKTSKKPIRIDHVLNFEDEATAKETCRQLNELNNEMKKAYKEYSRLAVEAHQFRVGLIRK